MTTISPLLQNRISSKGSNKNQNLTNHHEKLYEDLQKRANEVKPNQAKARLVEEGMLGNPITYAKDIIQDGKNFFATVKTGKMGDNNLGRINDFGLKIGAALIASFLAVHSKTKTDSIMRFIGGATFIAAMEMWPKLFINIPARIVHGFRIDRKYISAQGDKKDFFLDNQFLVWDAYPEEQLRKDAQNAGIDYDSKNGKEKIQRKMQKTALQNRTLWMATAGFATPLLTAMFGNYITPKVEEAVVKNGVQNTKDNLYRLDNYLAGKPKKAQSSLIQKIKNTSFIQNIEAKKAAKANMGFTQLFKEYEGKALDDNFYSKLSELLNPTTYLQTLKDGDDATPFKEWKAQGLIDELEKAQKQFRSFDKEDLKTKLAQLEVTSNGSAKNGLMSFDVTLLGEAEAKKIVDELGDNVSQKDVEAILDKFGILGKARNGFLNGLKVKDDNKAFFEFVQKVNDELVKPLKSRSKAYLDLVNPVVGSKAESHYTLEYNKTLGKLLKSLGLDDYKTTLELRGAHTDNLADYNKTVVGMISSKIKELASGSDDEYKAFIRSLGSEAVDEGITSTIKILIQDENIAKIMPQTDKIDGVNVDGIKKALIGGSDNDKGLFRLLKNFISTKHTDLDAVKSKAVICANFERRVLKGDLKQLSEAQIKDLRKILYDGTISTAANRDYITCENDYLDLVNEFFNPGEFKAEIDTLGGAFEEALDKVSKVFKDVNGFNAGKAVENASENYMACGSLTQHMKNFATRLSNNKAWARIFAPMTIVLIAVTLLAQPLFGKIDKEFPEEGKNGGAK